MLLSLDMANLIELNWLTRFGYLKVVTTLTPITTLIVIGTSLVVATSKEVLTFALIVIIDSHFNRGGHINSVSNCNS